LPINESAIALQSSASVVFEKQNAQPDFGWALRLTLASCHFTLPVCRLQTRRSRITPAATIKLVTAIATDDGSGTAVGAGESPSIVSVGPNPSPTMAPK
jgi:hypothetical protein